MSNGFNDDAWKARVEIDKLKREIYGPGGKMAYEARRRREKLARELKQVSPKPPNPSIQGWDAVFDWYYKWQKETGQRMTSKDLANKINYDYGYVRQCKAEYDAEHSRSK